MRNSDTLHTTNKRKPSAVCILESSVSPRCVPGANPHSRVRAWGQVEDIAVKVWEPNTSEALVLHRLNQIQLHQLGCPWNALNLSVAGGRAGGKERKTMHARECHSSAHAMRTAVQSFTTLNVSSCNCFLLGFSTMSHNFFSLSYTHPHGTGVHFTAVRLHSTLLCATFPVITAAVIDVLTSGKNTSS